MDLENTIHIMKSMNYFKVLKLEDCIFIHILDKLLLFNSDRFPNSVFYNIEISLKTIHYRYPILEECSNASNGNILLSCWSVSQQLYFLQSNSLPTPGIFLQLDLHHTHKIIINLLSDILREQCPPGVINVFVCLVRPQLKYLKKPLQIIYIDRHSTYEISIGLLLKAG